MSILSKISQKESLDKLDKEGKREILRAQVLGTMQEPLTAREIAKQIGRTTRQDIQPRLTELKELGIIETKGRKYDKITDRNVTAYVLAGDNM